MAFTPLKGFSAQSQGQNPGTWGTGAPTALNEGVILPLDNMLAGVATFSLSASNVTLSTANAQNLLFRFTGTLTANIVVGPDVGVLFSGIYAFENLTTGNFTITLTTSAGSVVLPQSRRGIFIVDTTNGPRIFSSVSLTNLEPIPTGSVMLFYQNAAPAGWTIYSALDDYALKISASGGGVTSGSLAYSTVFGRTATDAYTLQIADIPSHTHTISAPVCGGSGNDQPGVAKWTALTVNNYGPTAVTSSSVGGSGPHSHGINLQVRTAAVILATKN
ncbi:hypothetical protein [Hyphomicrobium sp. 2TAF46]|uniref:hypothetical protein n=1 Tax=Hyphomicrobium sp. 2TAF46 TaxID=3233019 RepID=UPI003F91F7F9